MTAYEFLADGLFLRALFFSSTIPYGDIKGARVVNFFQSLPILNPFLPLAVSLVSGLRWRYVLLETKKDRLILLTPDDPEDFVQTLNNKMQAH